MSQTNIVITDGVTTHKDVLDVVNLNSVDAENRISTLETDGVGASAYEVAVNEGFVGDESAWLASLVGADGADGPTGDDGLNGVDGTNGIDGSNGVDGSDGLTGDTGPTGPTGNTGATGPSGPAGSPGPVGPTGPTGPSGSDGSDGATGSTGPSGPAGNDGATGPTGPAGSVGSEGPQGNEGPQGVQGVQGIQGADGEAGSGITFKGQVATLGDLPASADSGDAYLVQADDSLNIYDGSNFVSGGSIQGPQGVQGIQGFQGVPGIQGESGVNGLDGPQGATGPTGPAGSDGADGATGPAGSDGVDGAVGPTGPTGADGITGPAGTAGTDGKTVLSGSVAPVSEGSIGDFYINTDTDEIYGPKSSDSPAWGQPTSLIGPGINLQDATTTVYVSKEGGPTASGLTLDDTIDTIGGAIGVANVLISSGSDSVSINVVDAGTYTDSFIVIPTNVHLDAPNITFVGSIELSDNSSASVDKHYPFEDGPTPNNSVSPDLSAGSLVHSSYPGECYYKANLMDTRGLAGNFQYITALNSWGAGQRSRLNFSVGDIKVGTFCIAVHAESEANGCFMTGVIGSIHLLGSSAEGLLSTGSGSSIICKVDYIFEDTSISNFSSTRAISVSGSSQISAYVNSISADTAYETQGQLWLSCLNITGAKIGSPQLEVSEDTFSVLVKSSGTPLDGQLAVFTDPNTIEGGANLAFDPTNGLKVITDNSQIAGQVLTCDSSGFGTWESPSVAFVNSESIVYVSKDGSDANSGLTYDNPLDSILDAIVVANNLITSGANGVKIEVIDGETYAEASILILETNIHLNAPSATIEGSITFKGNSSAIVNKHYPIGGGDALVSVATQGESYYQANLMDGRGLLGSEINNVLLNINGSPLGRRLTFNVGSMIVGASGRGISNDASGSFNNIDGNVGNIILAGNGSTGITTSQRGNISISVGRIVENSMFGNYTTEALDISSNVSTNVSAIKCNEIESNVAYNISGLGKLWLSCLKISGSKTGTPQLEISEDTFPQSPANNVVTTTTTTYNQAVGNTHTIYDDITAGGDISATLMSASDHTGTSIHKKVGDSYTVTITPQSGTIDGQSSFVLLSENESVSIFSDGTNFYII
jgi:hypothetical protein